jgi:hypothetical protein
MRELSPQGDMLPARLTEHELARHWRLSRRTLQRWREARIGPPWLKIGGRVLYQRQDVLAFEKACLHKGAV